MTLLAPKRLAFFTGRLIGQRRASPHRVACYREAFRLLLAFGYERTGTALVPLRLEDLDAPLILNGTPVTRCARDCGDMRASGTVPSAWPLISSPGIHTRRI
jgi:hypothetical protein